MEIFENKDITDDSCHKFFPRYLKSAYSPFESKETFVGYLVIAVIYSFISYKINAIQFMLFISMNTFLIAYSHSCINKEKVKYRITDGIGLFNALLIWVFMFFIAFYVSCFIFGLREFIGTINREGLLFYSFAAILFCAAHFMAPVILVVYAKNLKFIDAINPKVVFSFIYKNFVPLLQNFLASMAIYSCVLLLSLTYGLINSKILSMVLLVFTKLYEAYWVYFTMHINSIVMKNSK